MRCVVEVVHVPRPPSPEAVVDIVHRDLNPCVSGVVVDIAHRDLKLDNIMVMGTHDSEAVNVKVRLCCK